MAESVFVQTIAASSSGSDKQRLSAGEGEIRETRDGGAARILVRDYIRAGGGLSKVRDGIGLLLKWLARSLYFSPAFALAYAITSGHVAALVVATFVGLVLVFFVVLCVYVVAAFIAFGESSRRTLARPSLSLSVDPAHVADTQDPGRPVTVRGRVVRLRGKAVIVADGWQAEERTTYADVFGIHREKGLPIVVLPTTAPTLVAPHDPAAESLAQERGLFGAVSLMREGDIVTVRGLVLDRIANVNAFELDGEVLRFGESSSGDANDAMPYREGQLDAGLLLSDSRDEPLQIKVEKRA